MKRIFLHYVLGVAFFPVVAPAAAVCGGGLLTGALGMFHENQANDGEYSVTMLTKERKKLESRLEILRTDLNLKQPVIDSEKKN